MKERISVGLDIGSSAVKAVRLKRSKGAFSLIDVAVEENKGAQDAVIKKITDSLGLKNINISVSGPSVILRYVVFPKMSKEELTQALKFEAPKYIPFPVEELNLDSYILVNNMPDNKMLVLLAGVKKDYLSARLKIISDLGLKADIIDIDSIALVNAFNFNYPRGLDAERKATCLLNMGASLTNLNILEEGIPRLSRDINIGGTGLTQAIEPAVAGLVNEIRSSFDYFESQAATSVIKIFLSGGGSLLPGLKDTLANLLGIEAQYWDPLEKIEIADSQVRERVKAISSQLAVAVGLALNSAKQLTSSATKLWRTP